jgi:DNA helicase-2/ATP-dependent DNA helicase PcrA
LRPLNPERPTPEGPRQQAFEGLSAAPAQPKNGFRVGEWVRHANFGEGQVTAVQGSGDDALVTVLFRKVGKKTLMAGMARLERV